MYQRWYRRAAGLMLVSEQMASGGAEKSEYMMRLQESFKEEMFDYFGGDIVGSDTHPLKSAFLLYIKMKEEEQEEEDKEEK